MRWLKIRNESAISFIAILIYRTWRRANLHSRNFIQVRCCNSKQIGSVFTPSRALPRTLPPARVVPRGYIVNSLLLSPSWGYGKATGGTWMCELAQVGGLGVPERNRSLNSRHSHSRGGVWTFLNSIYKLSISLGPKLVGVQRGTNLFSTCRRKPICDLALQFEMAEIYSRPCLSSLPLDSHRSHSHCSL